MRYQSAKMSNKTVNFSPTPRNGGHTPPHAASVRGHQHQLSPSEQGETWQTNELRHTKDVAPQSLVPSCTGALVAWTVPADPQTTSLPLTTCRQPPEREPPNEPWPLGGVNSRKVFSLRLLPWVRATVRGCCSLSWFSTATNRRCTPPCNGKQSTTTSKRLLTPTTSAPSPRLAQTFSSRLCPQLPCTLWRQHSPERSPSFSKQPVLEVMTDFGQSNFGQSMLANVFCRPFLASPFFANPVLSCVCSGWCWCMFCVLCVFSCVVCCWCGPSPPDALLFGTPMLEVGCQKWISPNWIGKIEWPKLVKQGWPGIG